MKDVSYDDKSLNSSDSTAVLIHTNAANICRHIWRLTCRTIDLLLRESVWYEGSFVPFPNRSTSLWPLTPGHSPRSPLAHFLSRPLPRPLQAPGPGMFRRGCCGRRITSWISSSLSRLSGGCSVLDAWFWFWAAALLVSGCKDLDPIGTFKVSASSEEEPVCEDADEEGGRDFSGLGFWFPFEAAGEALVFLATFWWQALPRFLLGPDEGTVCVFTFPAGVLSGLEGMCEATAASETAGWLLSTDFTVLFFFFFFAAIFISNILFPLPPLAKSDPSAVPSSSSFLFFFFFLCSVLGPSAVSLCLFLQDTAAVSGQLLCPFTWARHSTFTLITETHKCF